MPPSMRSRRRTRTNSAVATVLLCSSLSGVTSTFAFQRPSFNCGPSTAQLGSKTSRPRVVDRSIDTSTALNFADPESGSSCSPPKSKSDKNHRGFGVTSSERSRSSGSQRQRRKNSSRHNKRKKLPDRKRFQQQTLPAKNDKRIAERYVWLRNTTQRLLDVHLYPPGSLVKGKWHELSSMMLAWSRMVKDGTYERVLELMTTQQDQQQKETPKNNQSNVNARLKPPLIIEALLKRLIDEKGAGNDDVVITVDTYNIAVEAWAAAAGGGGAEASISTERPQSYGAPAVIDRKGDSRQNDGRLQDEEIPSAGTSQALASARRALEIVRSLQNAYETSKDEALRPNAHSFLAAIGSFTRAACYTSSSSISDREAAAEEAEGTLRWMEDLAKCGKNIYAAPGTLAFSLAMDAFCKSGRDDAGQKAEAIFRDLESKSLLESASALEGTSGALDRSRRASANTFCYNILINAYNRQGRRGGAVDSAQRILTEMEQRYNETLDESVRPDVVTYTSVINAWARANRKGYGAEMAENILNSMEAAGIQNTITYNSVLKTWARSRDGRAPARAEALFKRMEKLDKEGTSRVRPDRISYNTLIHCLSNGGNAQTADRAESILFQMEDLSKTGTPELGPNLFTWNTCIDAWSKSNAPFGAERAYSLLRKLIANQNEKESNSIRPDKFSYNSVIRALSRSSSPDAAIRAEELLGMMEKASADGSNPDADPDVYSYSSVIHAWSRSGRRVSGKMAEVILNRMEHLSKQAGKESLKPNSVSFNSAIDAWAKSGEGTLGARRAEELLRRMEDLYAAGDESVKPTASSYNSVISAWARSGTRCAYWKAEELVNRMWERYESGSSDVRPDHCSFNTLINAISKSQREGKAEKALRVLRRMDLLYRAGYKYARPNEMTYTSVLNSCAFTFVENDLSKRKALDVAIFTLEELQESHYGNPNHITYGMFLKACSNLMSNDDERWRRVVEPVVEQCRRDGCVGELVLKQLQHAAPEHLYQSLIAEVYVRDGNMGDNTRKGKMRIVKFSDLPEEWRCNVRENKRWRSRNWNTSSSMKRRSARRKSYS